MEHSTVQTPYRRRSGVGTGTTSLLMIFTVLCFVTLSMLSLGTALSSSSVQTRGMNTARQVAAVQGEAARQVALLDERLLSLRGAAAENYAGEALLAATELGFETNEELRHVVLLLPMDDKMELLTELELTDAGQPYRYVLVRQETRLIGGWQPGPEGDVWSGE